MLARPLHLHVHLVASCAQTEEQQCLLLSGTPLLMSSLCGQHTHQVQHVSGGAQIEEQEYPVLIDALATVFSPYGQLEKMAIFEKNGMWQVGIRMPHNLQLPHYRSRLDPRNETSLAEAAAVP